MTRAQLNTLIASWLDDPNQGYFTPTQVNVWLNLAQRTVQTELLQAGQNWYMKPVETYTVRNQADYVLPSDFRVLHRVEVVLSGTGVNENRQPVKSMSTNEQDLVGLQVGVPTNFFIKKNRITLFPIPDQQYVLRLYYSPLVQDMTQDSDSPDVPEEFMEYVAIVAAFDGFIKDDRAPENLLVKKKYFQELLEQMAEERVADQPRQVIMTEDYDNGRTF